MKNISALLLAAFCFVSADDVQASAYAQLEQQAVTQFQLNMLQYGVDHGLPPQNTLSRVDHYLSEIRIAVDKQVAKNTSCLKIKSDWLTTEQEAYESEQDTRQRTDQEEHDRLMAPVGDYVLYYCMRSKGK